MARAFQCVLAGAVLIATTALPAPLPANAQTRQQLDWCSGMGGATQDLTISGCTAVIQSGKWSGKNLATVFYNRGIVYRAKGDLDRAIADYNEAIRLDPKYALAFNNRGIAYRAKGEYDRAIADYNEAIRLDPKFAIAFYNRGLAYYVKGDTDIAIADYSEAIRLDPKFAIAFKNRGNAYEQKGDYVRAALNFDEVTRLLPANADAWNSCCRARAIAGRELQQALSDCNESLRLIPNDANTLNSRGFTYLMLGQIDNAIADYDVALKLDPKQAASLYGRGVAKLKKGDSDAGNADITAAGAVEVGIAERFAKYGIRSDDTVVSTATPTSTTAADCARAETHWKSAEEIKTLAVYEDHLARFPTCDFAALAKARIEALKK